MIKGILQKQYLGGWGCLVAVVVWSYLYVDKCSVQSSYLLWFPCTNKSVFQVNLRSGVPQGSRTDTCTAGAGSLLVEFGILSRLIGDPVYELSARRANRVLWKLRNAETGLLGKCSVYSLSTRKCLQNSYPDHQDHSWYISAILCDFIVGLHLNISWHFFLYKGSEESFC